jgi:RNA polymerase sigma-70 factor (ECF subfamily)
MRRRNEFDYNRISVKVPTSVHPLAIVQERIPRADRPSGRRSGPGQPERGLPKATALTGNFKTDFRAIYDAWFNDVSRWIRALGGPEADRDDIVQEVFLVVRRRLGAFDGSNLPGWLYRITRRQVRDFRRRSWVKHIFSKHRGDLLDELPHGGGTPATALERKESQRVLNTLLMKMNDDRRSTFVLFEIEGLSGEEIAVIQKIPVNTVWTRLHHARKEFFALATRYQTNERKGR